jgi:hypothetical protein
MIPNQRPFQLRNVLGYYYQAFELYWVVIKNKLLGKLLKKAEGQNRI